MRRVDLEHIIRAAVQIADDDEIIVIGSQSVLGQFPDAPADRFIRAAIRSGMATLQTLELRLADLPVDAGVRGRIRGAIEADFA